MRKWNKRYRRRRIIEDDSEGTHSSRRRRVGEELPTFLIEEIHDKGHLEEKTKSIDDKDEPSEEDDPFSGPAFDTERGSGQI